MTTQINYNQIKSAPVNVKDYGATGDGSTDDAAAVQAAITACPQYGSVFFPDGTYIIGSLLTVSTNNIDLFGNAILKAKAATNYSLMLTASGRTGVRIIGLEFDVNGANRSSVQTSTYNAVAFPTSIDCAAINVTVRNARGYNSTSATSMSASGATRFLADGCKFIDCGANATTLPSDGLFVRGDGCLIVNCQAYRCTDTAFVLEGCNYSIISNCTAIECTAIGAISNDTSSDCIGNEINGLTGSTSFIGSTGGIVGISCSSTGSLRQTTVSNVSIRIETGATGLGPGMQIRKTSSGRVDDLSVNNLVIDVGSSTGSLAQGVLCQSSDYVRFNSPYIKQDTIAASGTDCIKFDGSCAGCIVNDGYLVNGVRGINVADTSDVLIQNVRFKDQDDYGVSVTDTAVVTCLFNVTTGASLIAAVFSDATATLISTNWQAWTPNYSSNLGNAAATFSGGTVTTTLARYSIAGKTCTVNVNYLGTLNAVSPAYIDLTLPTGVSPASTSVNSPAAILNDVTYETGIVRTISNALRFSRANLSAYSTSAQVAGLVSFSFEIS